MRSAAAIEERLNNAYDYIRKQTSFVPETAIVLGSGLGHFEEAIRTECVIEYSRIPDFPATTTPGHQGRFLFGTVCGVKVGVMQGRFHYYEGYSMEDIVLPIRLLHNMGASVLFLTNASGAIDPTFRPGDFMVIDDHISCFMPSVLRGPNPDSLGPRFPDMSEVYDRGLRQAIDLAGEKLGLRLRHGVYVQLQGPSFETPAEIRMLGRLGADAVGMSTACEALAAKHLSMKVCGIACISNLAAGISAQPLSIDEVYETSKKTAPVFTVLMKESIKNIAEITGK